ncbi:DUF3010 family protein [Marinomonas agarivorans]|nr:DUF3010 family protein [Marinomonas agarivorans]
MITCGVDIKGSEAILCLLSKTDGLFQIVDCRQVRVTLVKDNISDNIKKFQFTLQKLFEDYQVTNVVIRERPTKGKFSGGATGFKIEAAIQLIDSVTVTLLNNTEIKARLKDNPLPISYADTGLKAFQESAFSVAYAALSASQ